MRATLDACANMNSEVVKSENNAFEQSCIRKLLQMDIIDPLWTWNSAPEGAQYIFPKHSYE